MSDLEISNMDDDDIKYNRKLFLKFIVGLLALMILSIWWLG